MGFFSAKKHTLIEQAVQKGKLDQSATDSAVGLHEHVRVDYTIDLQFFLDEILYSIGPGIKNPGNPGLGYTQ